jgi:hypothetical protein
MDSFIAWLLLVVETMRLARVTSHPVDLVVVEECPARGLQHADAGGLQAAVAAQIGALQVGIREQLADRLGAVQQLDHPCPMGRECRLQRATLAGGGEVLTLLLGQRGVETQRSC